MTTAILTDAPITEDPRTQVRRRLQQKRCLACGAAQLVNHATSYFCAAHIDTHRYCSTCEVLRTTEAHGKDSRCKTCARSRALACYYEDPDRNIYRIRLKQIASRSCTRADQIFSGMRRRILLAACVRATPGLSWNKRAAIIGGHGSNLAAIYRAQCAGLVRDVDSTDRARDAHWSEQ